MISVSFAREKGAAPREDLEVNVAEFIAVKGIRAQGNQLSADKIKAVRALPPLPYDEPEEEIPEDPDPDEREEGDEPLDDTQNRLTDPREEQDDEPLAVTSEQPDISSDTQNAVDDGGQTSLF